jgi:hypothetical protein
MLHLFTGDWMTAGEGKASCRQTHGQFPLFLCTFYDEVPSQQHMDVGTFAAYRSAITWPIVQLELCKCNHPGRDRLLYKAQLPNYLGTIGLAADLGSLMRSLDGNAHAPSRLAHQVA